jgi:hypothetical protein
MRIPKFLETNWQSHPVRLAAIAGALVGVANALITEIGGLLHKNSGGVLTMLFPPSMFGTGINGMRVIQTATVLVIEVAANVAVWTALLAAPVAVIVAVRRTIAGRQG